MLKFEIEEIEKETNDTSKNGKKTEIVYAYKLHDSYYYYELVRYFYTWRKVS